MLTVNAIVCPACAEAVRPHQHPQALGNLEAPRLVDAVQQDGEFLAAQPANQVMLADPGAETADEVLQGRIAGRMSELIVDLFEVVDIQHQSMVP